MMMEPRVLLVLFVVFLARAYAQDQSGFISIDCGMPENSTYTDKTTGLIYVSDENYIDTGVSTRVPSTNGLPQQLIDLRSFPEGLRNCYTLKPPNVTGQSRYFIRAGFWYGNYDNKNSAPIFDIYLGVDYWNTVYTSVKVPVSIEILYNPSSSYTYVCLVNTRKGTPFISVLELRLVPDDMYVTPTKSSLALYGHWDLRSYDDRNIIRYGDDIFDRVWQPSFFETGTVEINTKLIIDKNRFILPSTVVSTAVTPQNASESLNYMWTPDDPESNHFIYMHFADFQNTQLRKFDIILNDGLWSETFTPNYLSAVTLFNAKPLTKSLFNFSLTKTSDSVLPPMINAVEVYIQQDFLGILTNQQDVDAIKTIKFTYGLKKNWQGDPCTPTTYSWLGLSCFNDNNNNPRITSLNLSFSGLTGTLSPSIQNLTMLTFLDLSNNTLTGEVPNFLSRMLKLSVLNLSGNNFTGTIPSGLIERSADGSLKLSYGGNPNLCSPGVSCKSPTASPPPVGGAVKKKISSMLLPIVAAVAGVFVLLIALAIIWVCIVRNKTPLTKKGKPVAIDVTSGKKNMERDGQISTQRQNYTYAEVKQMTWNFGKELGKGGFGSVFYGCIENIEVAVKMLSPSSAQGYRQFKAEAELLMRVHHRNLTTLVGYCDEGGKLGLIYEFMANGDLETHLSDKNLMCLSWDSRLEIVLDAAQGLEYLHHGCKPPIIHRDIKTTNILLDNEMQAKIADFGLSKASRPADGSTYVSSSFAAGTPGYFDPEFNMNETSDVYSFGVVLLEILTGKPPIAKGEERTHISRWVTQTLETNGDVRNVVDPRLGNDYDINSAWKLVDLAMSCVAQTSVHRPTMNQVVTELKQCRGKKKARMKKETQHSDLYSNVNFESAYRNPMAR